MKLTSVALVALTLLVIWQEVRIQLLTRMHPQHGELMFELGRLADDLDWAIRQLPEHDGMRPSDFQR